MNELLNTIVKQFIEKPELCTKENLDALTAIYKKIGYEILSYCFGYIKDWINNDDYFETMAKYDKQRYDAWIKVGFTPDEAFSLLIKEQQNSTKALNNMNSSLQQITKNMNK